MESLSERSGRRLHPQELVKISQAASPNEKAVSSAKFPKINVTIVILSCERFHLTRRTIESIYTHTNYPFRVLIFDNGSSQSTIKELKILAAEYKNLRIHYNPVNLGAAEGRNTAFSMVEHGFVVSMDNDILCHPGWLQELVSVAHLYEANFVEPMRLDLSGMVWSHGAELISSSEGEVIEIARWFHDLPCSYVQNLFTGKSFQTNYISGGAGLFKVSDFFDCGGFDPNLHSFEDIEFCIRMNQNGFAVWTCAQALLTHDDDWVPASEMDIEYTRHHYDLQRCKQAADRIKTKWGVNVFPQKYVDAYEKRLDNKLKGSSFG